MDDKLVVPPASDFHVHLRQGDMTKMLVPLIKPSGVQRVLVMPNLKPPVTTTAQALEYKAQLQALCPDVEYLMTLYLSPDLTPEEVEKAAAAGITGVKSYPRGVTTNSDSGIEDYEVYFPVFAAMEKHDLVLNLHGEVPSCPENNVCVLNAEERFLPQLERLHRHFPSLRIVLEHATTAAAVDMVKRLGPTVAATITVHHIDLVIDDALASVHCFCKPVAKYPVDRDALRQVIKEGNPKFFLGSDSAPHPRSQKESAAACAGVFTGALILPYLASTLDALGCLSRLRAFACEFGCAFYRVPVCQGEVTLQRRPTQVPPELLYGDAGEVVVPFKAGKTLPWSLCA